MEGEAQRWAGGLFYFYYLVEGAENSVGHMIVNHDGRDEDLVKIDRISPNGLVDGIARFVLISITFFLVKGKLRQFYVIARFLFVTVKRNYG